MGAYEGLAVPLAGAYTQTTKGGTATLLCDNYGFTTLTLDQTAAYMADEGSGGVEGLRVRVNVNTACGGATGAAFWLDHAAGANTGQLYAAEFWITGASSSDVASGMIAPIHLVNYLTSGYSGITVGNAAYFVVHEAFDSVYIPNLFIFSGMSADTTNCMFKNCVAAAADHALAIDVDGVRYYIMLSNTTAT